MNLTNSRILRMLVLIAGTMAPSAIRAQETSATSDAACQGSFEYLSRLARLGSSPYRAAYVDGWCEIRDLTILQFIDIKSVRWRISGWETLTAHNLPDALDLRVSGIRFYTYRQAGSIDPLMGYILNVSASAGPGGSGRLDFIRVDNETGKPGRDYNVKAFEFEVSPGNSILFSGRLRNVNLAELLESALGITAIHVDRGRLEITSHGGFETMLFPQLAFRLLHSSDPEAEFAALKERTIENIQQKGGFLGASSQDALVRLVADMPNPAGVFKIEMFPENGFALSRLAGLAQTDDPEDVLGEANLSFAYDQTR